MIIALFVTAVATFVILLALAVCCAAADGDRALTETEVRAAVRPWGCGVSHEPVDLGSGR